MGPTEVTPALEGDGEGEGVTDGVLLWLVLSECEADREVEMRRPAVVDGKAGVTVWVSVVVVLCVDVLEVADVESLGVSLAVTTVEQPPRMNQKCLERLG